MMLMKIMTRNHEKCPILESRFNRKVSQSSHQKSSKYVTLNLTAYIYDTCLVHFHSLCNGNLLAHKDDRSESATQNQVIHADNCNLKTFPLQNE